MKEYMQEVNEFKESDFNFQNQMETDLHPNFIKVAGVFTILFTYLNENYTDHPQDTHSSLLCAFKFNIKLLRNTFYFCQVYDRASLSWVILMIIKVFNLLVDEQNV